VTKLISLRPWQKYKVIVYATTIFFLILLTIFKQKLLSNYLVWEDEFETIITTRMILNGDKLYQDVFNPHGPSTFILGLILETFGLSSIFQYRSLIFLLQIGVILSITFSPVITKPLTRILIFSISIFFYLTEFIDYFSHTYTYQNIAGLSLAFIFAQVLIPITYSDYRPTRLKIFIGILLTVNLIFLAVTYIPISLIILFLIYSSINKKLFMMSIVTGTLLNTLFIIFYASWKGYLVQHFYINSQITPKFYPFQNLTDFPMNIYRSLGQNFWLFAIIMTMFFVVALQLSHQRIYKPFLLLVGLLSLLIRGVEFQALPFYYIIPTLLLLILSKIERIRNHSIFILPLFFIFVYSFYLSFYDEKIQNNQIPTINEFKQLTEFFTNKNDEVFSYTFANSQYVIADRLPVSPYFFYLPMQYEYDRNPVLGVKFSICEDLKKSRPKVGYLEVYDFSSKLPWNQYATCVDDFIAKNYFQLPFNTLYIRRDLLTGIINDESLRPEGKMIPSRKVDKSNLVLNTTANSITSQIRINGIGILFATYGKNIEGSITFNAKSSQKSISASIAGNKIVDNRYTFIDLPAGNYTEFSLISENEIDLSIWQFEEDLDLNLNSCIVMRYENETFKITPGCLPF
jgi:hypothetical protein